MEPLTLILPLLQNVALLVALVSVYRVFMVRYNQDTILYQVLVGILFGGVGLVGMLTPLQILPGVILDGRSVILSAAGFSGGPIVAGIAALLCVVYRLWLGGDGAWVGVGVILASAAAGVLFYYLRRRLSLPMRLPILWGFGLLVHGLMLALMLALPQQSGFTVVAQIGIPILVFYPLTTVLVCWLILDSEAQVRDRQALLKSEKALLKAQRVAHVGSWVWDIQQNRLEWTDEMYRIFGIQKEHFSGNLAEVIAQAIHPDDRAAVEAANARVIQQSTPLPLEYRVRRPDGTVRTVWAEAGELVLDRKGSPIRLTGIVQDITERRAAEREVLESESRYRNLILHAPDAIFVNHEDQVALVNDACLKLFGAQDEKEILGKSPKDLFHPDFHEGIRERIHTLRVLNKPVPVKEEKIVRLDGQVVDVDVVAAPFLAHGSNDIHVILRDITERKKMQEELRKSHDLLTRLAEQVPGVIFQLCIDPTGKAYFPYISPGLEGIIGLSPEDVREDATPLFKRLHPEDQEWIAANILTRAGRSPALFQGEFRVVFEDRMCWRLCHAKPERMENGDTLWYGIITDIDPEKQSEQKISEQLDELRRWYSVMLGREKRMIELKREVNQLLEQLGQPVRYHEAEAGAHLAGELPPVHHDPGPFQPAFPRREGGSA